jgi:hypothetical protein
MTDPFFDDIDFLFEEPKLTDGEGNFNHDYLWRLTRHGYFCFICKRSMPDWEPQYCCNGRDCGCYGYPIEPPICSKECWTVALDFDPDFKHMWR